MSPLSATLCVRSIAAREVISVFTPLFAAEVAVLACAAVVALLKRVK
jgi:hypothetical protein